MPKVLNRYGYLKLVPVGAVLVARPSKWGNPFKIGRDGSRSEVVALYRQYILSNPKLMAALPELKGKDLVCYCAPFLCHADILLELANE